MVLLLYINANDIRIFFMHFVTIYSVDFFSLQDYCNIADMTALRSMYKEGNHRPVQLTAAVLELLLNFKNRFLLHCFIAIFSLSRTL